MIRMIILLALPLVFTSETTTATTTSATTATAITTTATSGATTFTSTDATTTADTTPSNGTLTNGTATTAAANGSTFLSTTTSAYNFNFTTTTAGTTPAGTSGNSHDPVEKIAILASIIEKAVHEILQPEELLYNYDSLTTFAAPVDVSGMLPALVNVTETALESQFLALQNLASAAQEMDTKYSSTKSPVQYLRDLWAAGSYVDAESDSDLDSLSQSYSEQFNKKIETLKSAVKIPQYCNRDTLDPDACLANPLDENLKESTTGETCLKRQKKVIICGEIANITNAISNSATIDSAFNKSMNTYSGVRWQYWASADEPVTRIFPGTIWDEDSVLPEVRVDGRRESWFLGAAVGPRRVIIIIDTSGSMDEWGRISTAKEVASSILTSLGPTDRVAVIQMSATPVAYTCANSNSSSPLLVQATPETLSYLDFVVRNFSVGGAGDSVGAINVAVDALSGDSSFGESSCSLAHLFFITGGQVADPSSTLSSRNSGNRIKFYGALVGAKVSSRAQSMMNRMACNNGGATRRVQYSWQSQQYVASLAKVYPLRPVSDSRFYFHGPSLDPISSLPGFIISAPIFDATTQALKAVVAQTISFAASLPESMIRAVTNSAGTTVSVFLLDSLDRVLYHLLMDSNTRGLPHVSDVEPGRWWVWTQYPAGTWYTEIREVGVNDVYRGEYNFRSIASMPLRNMWTSMGMRLFLSIDAVVDSDQKITTQCSTTSATVPQGQLYHRVDLDPISAALAHVSIAPARDPLQGELITRNSTTFKFNPGAFLNPDDFTDPWDDAADVSQLNLWLRNRGGSSDGLSQYAMADLTAIATLLPKWLFAANENSTYLGVNPALRIYVATSSGILVMYPGRTLTGLEPENRVWWARSLHDSRTIFVTHPYEDYFRKGTHVVTIGKMIMPGNPLRLHQYGDGVYAVAALDLLYSDFYNLLNQTLGDSCVAPKYCVVFDSAAIVIWHPTAYPTGKSPPNKVFLGQDEGPLTRWLIEKGAISALRVANNTADFNTVVRMNISSPVSYVESSSLCNVTVYNVPGINLFVAIFTPPAETKFNPIPKCESSPYTLRQFRADMTPTGYTVPQSPCTTASAFADAVTPATASSRASFSSQTCLQNVEQAGVVCSSASHSFPFLLLTILSLSCAFALLLL